MANLSVKEKITRAFTDLLGQQSFSSIKVIDVVTAAGVSHMSFYRNYSDKYALLEDICYTDFNAFLRIYGRDAKWKDIVYCILHCINNNQTFYRRIFMEESSLQVAVSAMMRISMDHTGATGSKYAMDIWRIIFSDWAKDHFADSVDEVYWRLISNMPTCDMLSGKELRQVLDRYGNTSLASFRAASQSKED